MKIQFAAELKDHRGIGFTEVDTEKSVVGQVPVTKPTTLGSVCCAVLDLTFQDEVTEGMIPKLRRGEMMEKIFAAERAHAPLELLDADCEMLKVRIGKRNFPTFLSVAAVRQLDRPALEPISVD